MALLIVPGVGALLARVEGLTILGTKQRQHFCKLTKKGKNKPWYRHAKASSSTWCFGYAKPQVNLALDHLFPSIGSCRVTFYLSWRHISAIKAAKLDLAGFIAWSQGEQFWWADNRSCEPTFSARLQRATWRERHEFVSMSFNLSLYRFSNGNRVINNTQS